MIDLAPDDPILLRDADAGLEDRADVSHSQRTTRTYEIVLGSEATD